MPTWHMQKRFVWMWGSAWVGAHVLATCWLPSHAWAELPSSLPDSGSLLVSAPLIPGVEAGVYGPRFVSANEPALIGLLLAGDAQTSIAHGFVVIAASDEAADFTQAPAPSGAYLLSRQSDPSNAEWLPLLSTGSTSLWSLRVLPMAHSLFRLGAGAILDATILSPHLPQPPRGSVFRTVSDRSRKDYDSFCIAFLTDEHVGTGLLPATAPASDGSRPAGAQALRLSFPLEFSHPNVTLSFWLAVDINGQAVGQGLTVPIGANRPRVLRNAPVDDVPTLSSPTPDTLVDKTVDVVGQTRPGALAVAWLQLVSPTQESPPPTTFIARRITDRDGRFNLRLPLPDRLTLSTTTVHLHVRTESPGYQSAPLIVPLRIAPSE